MIPTVSFKTTTTTPTLDFDAKWLCAVLSMNVIFVNSSSCSFCNESISTLPATPWSLDLASSSIIFAPSGSAVQWQCNDFESETNCELNPNALSVLEIISFFASFNLQKLKVH